RRYPNRWQRFGNITETVGRDANRSADSYLGVACYLGVALKRGWDIFSDPRRYSTVLCRIRTRFARSTSAAKGLRSQTRSGSLARRRVDRALRRVAIAR